MSWGWTDDNVETLKKLWSEGLSAAQIADEFGQYCSRNAVIGKINRLGLSKPATGAKPGPKQRQPKAEPLPQPCTIAPLAPTQTMGASRAALDDNRYAYNVAARKARGKPPAYTERQREKLLAALDNNAASDNARAERGEGVALLDLRHDSCRWPMGDPRTEAFLYCGEPRDGDAVYCACHRARAYIPTAPRPDVRFSDTSVGKSERGDGDPKELVL